MIDARRKLRNRDGTPANQSELWARVPVTRYRAKVSELWQVVAVASLFANVVLGAALVMR